MLFQVTVVYTIRTCTYILHMLVKTSEISAWRAFIIPFLFDPQHTFKISASVLMIWDQTEDTGLSFRRDAAFCTKNRRAKIRSALKLASSKSSASRCHWTATKVAFFYFSRWMIPIQHAFQLQRAYKWWQNIAKIQPSKSCSCSPNCCCIDLSTPYALGSCRTIGCHLSLHLNLTLWFRSTTIGESVWRTAKWRGSIES